MATVALTLENFEQTILEGGTVFVDFWAGWCGPCIQFAPNYEAASEANPDLVFAKVDTEDQQQLAAAMNITSIPTIMAFKDGIGVFAQAGALPRPMLDELVSQVRALDMEQVRADLARQEAEQAMASSDAIGER
jgi:thioredoxin 1